MFRRSTSKQESTFSFTVVFAALVLAFFTKSFYWFYAMALLLFLSGFIFRKQTKKAFCLDALGFVFLCILIFCLSYFGQWS